jgi:hypothetical protein
MADRIVVVPTQDKVTVIPGSPMIVKVVAGGVKGDRGPGIDSNITKITASTTAPPNPQVNDLWIDIS